MSILNDVLDHSKIEAGKLTLSQAPVSLRALAGSVVSLFRANADSKGLDLVLNIDDSVVDWVFADAQRLKQVLLNLVGNAIKFTERGHVLLHLESRGEAPDGKERIAFVVEDTGLGIPDQAMSQLFQPFHQADGSRSRRQGGTGLGLAISQRIVEAMGGRIEVTTRSNAGSSFRFALDLERDPAMAHTPVTDSSLGALDSGGTLSGKVLLVEDNEVNRMIARQVLQSFGLEVVEAADGEAALSAFANEDFDVVLMDCQMPVMDGYTATREIRELEKQAGGDRVPILALTANAFDEDAALARESGMDGYLTKPYRREQLHEMLTAWI